MEKDTKRKSQCFADFSVDYVKQFSANDIAHAIQEAVIDIDYNKIVRATHLLHGTDSILPTPNVDKEINDHKQVPEYPEIFNKEVQWLIHGVFHKIGFYDYKK